MLCRDKYQNEKTRNKICDLHSASLVDKIQIALYIAFAMGVIVRINRAPDSSAVIEEHVPVLCLAVPYAPLS